MPRQDRVTRLINYAGALQRLRDAELYLADRTLPAGEREIEALKQHYLDLRTALTVSDRNRLGTASFEALCAAKRIVREWRLRDDEAYGRTQATVPPDFLEPKPVPGHEVQLGVVAVATISPVREAVQKALGSTHSILIEGTETLVRSVAPLDDQLDYDWLITWLTTELSSDKVDRYREIEFNRHCAWHARHA